MTRRFPERRLCAAAAGVAAALMLAGAELRAQGRTIEGTWMVLVTITTCGPDPVPIPNVPQFQSLVTFVRDGSIYESTGALAFAPNQRSEGHGQWSRLSDGRFLQRTIGLIRFSNNPQTVPPVEAGFQTITQTVALTDEHAFTSEGTTEFFRFDGTSYRSGCASAVGQRFP